MARLYRVHDDKTIGQITDAQLKFLVDMLEEPHCIFYQAGSQPLECEICVGEPERARQ